MKKQFRWLVAFLAVCMVLTILPPQAFAASLTYTDEYGVWTYEEESDGTVTITGFSGDQKNVVVPEKIDGKWVRKLGGGLFRNNDGLTMIVIPYGVKTIGAEVFSGCSKLEKVQLPNSLTELGDRAFADCAVLQDLYVPASVTQLGEGVFVDSPKINVRCGVNSATAEYLRKNKDDVANFTLIEVSPEPGANDITGIGSSSSEGMSTVGNLVTYEFGRMINGQREYTVVLADSMPDMELMQYLIIDEEQGYRRLDPQVYELIANRFQLVSLTQYDGSKTVDIAPKEEKGITSYNVWIVPTYDAGDYGCDVRYELLIGRDDLEKAGIERIAFSSGNELTGYHITSGSLNVSLVKDASNYYTNYVVDKRDTTQYNADGTVFSKELSSQSRAHKVAIAGKCVHINISRSISRDKNDRFIVDREMKNATINDGMGGSTVATFETVRNEAGKTLEKNGYCGTTVGNVSKEQAFGNAAYDGNGDFVKGHYTSIKPVSDGVYVNSSSHFTATEQGDSVRNTDVLWYEEETVRANNVSEAMQRTQENFPNQPSENTYDVSERSINSIGHHYEEVTFTDPNTGAQSTSTYESKWEMLKDHTYVGETGKYVGWDWSWSYEFDSGSESLSSYTVSEYQYSSSDDKWTKTTVTVAAKNGAGKPEDFKTVYSGELLADYTVNSWSYEFEETTASGADNWLLVEEKYNIDSNDEKFSEITNIVKGETTVTDGNGKVISQETKKDEMLDLEKSLMDTEKYENLDQLFDEALETVPGGDSILGEAESGLITGEVPESNTEDQVEHFHNEDGTTETVVVPAGSGNEPAPLSDSTPDENAEQPVTDEVPAGE